MPIDPIDPTANVLKLFTEGTKRTDDLRKSESRRVDDLREMSTKHVTQIMKIHLDHEKQFREQEQKHAEDLRKAEAKRIDAINAGSVQQLASLATQVVNTAETLRKSQEGIINSINERISKVEQVQYRTEGKSGVTDPMVEKFFTKIDTLIEAQASHKGEGAGKTYLWGWIVGAAGILGMIATLLLSL